MVDDSSIYANIKYLVNNIAHTRLRMKNSCHASKLLPNFYECLLLTCNQKPSNSEKSNEKMLRTLIDLRLVQEKTEKADMLEELCDKLLTLPSTSSYAKIVEFLCCLFLHRRDPAKGQGDLLECSDRSFLMENNLLLPGIFGLFYSNRHHKLFYPSEGIIRYFPLLPLKFTSKDHDEGFEDIEDECLIIQNFSPSYDVNAYNLAQFYATELDAATFNNFYEIKFAGSLKARTLRTILSPGRNIGNLNCSDLSTSLKYLLFGVSNGIFHVDQVTKKVIIQAPSKMTGYTKESLIKMLGPIAELGTNVLLLDHFIASKFNTTAATVHKFLTSFQKYYLNAKSQTLLLCDSLSSATGLLSFIAALDPYCRKFAFLREIAYALMEKLKADNEHEVKVLLNILYNICCTTPSLTVSSSYPDAFRIAIVVFDTYLKNVQSWINNGECDGMNEDFFIRPVAEFDSCYDRRFWTKKFVVDDSKVPNFIKPYVDMIFDAGRTVCLRAYLSNNNKPIGPCYKDSILRASDSIFSVKPSMDFICNMTPDSQAEKICFGPILRKQIDSMLRENISGQSLATYLLENCKFSTVFQFLRELYFSANGNFSSALTRELFLLSKGTHDDNICTHSSVINRILDNSLAFIYNIDNISFGAIKFNFISDDVEKCDGSRNLLLTDLFDLCCELRWPFNLVISQNSLQWMRRVFKFLLALRWAVLCMEDCWNYLRDRVVRALIQKRHQLLLYQREMKHYISQLENYVLHQVVDICWSTFDHDLTSCNTLDDVYSAHNKYINDIVTRCLLTPKAQPIFRSIHKLLDCAICFRQSLIDNENEEGALAEYNNFVVRSRGFVIVVAKLADRVYQPHLDELLIRLNYNNFYF